MLANDVLQETGAVRESLHAEIAGQRLAEVGKRGARADVDAGLDLRSREQHRHVFARMIRAWRAGIVAMVRGDDEKVPGTQVRQQVTQARVEALQVRTIAGNVVAV